MLWKQWNNSDKAVSNARKRKQLFHTNSIKSLSAGRELFTGADICLCAELLHLSKGFCVLSAPNSVVKPFLQKDFFFPWSEMLEIC